MWRAQRFCEFMYGVMYEVSTVATELGDFQIASGLNKIRLDANFIKTFKETSFLAITSRFSISFPHDEKIKIAMGSRFAPPERASSEYACFAFQKALCFLEPVAKSGDSLGRRGTPIS